MAIDLKLNSDEFNFIDTESADCYRYSLSGGSLSR